MLKIMVIGHLGKDATTNTVNGKSVINFSVAHTEKFKDSQGTQKEKTTWVECAYWTDRTAVAPYLKKGTQVYVDGTPEVRTYQKNDGSMGVSLTCRVFSVQLLGSAQGQQPAAAPAGNSPQKSQPTSAADVTEPIDDLPF